MLVIYKKVTESLSILPSHHNCLPVSCFSLPRITAHRQWVIISWFMTKCPTVFYPLQQYTLYSSFDLLYAAASALLSGTNPVRSWCRGGAELIRSRWSWFMSKGISGQNSLIEPVYSPGQSLRKGSGNEGEYDERKTLWSYISLHTATGRKPHWVLRQVQITELS